MKMLNLPDETIQAKDTDTLQKFLLDRVLKLRKVDREMKNSVAVQKAEDLLAAAKAPFRKARSKWLGEMQAVELELKTRNIKYNINWDDIYEENEDK